jgi:spore coat protein U-like protein
MRGWQAMGAVAALLCVQASGLCATRSTTFTVAVVVDNDCVISNANDLDFGHIGPHSGGQMHLDMASQVAQLSVVCSRNTRYTLYLDSGNVAGSSVDTRLMAGSTPGNEDRLLYQLYLDPACSLVWGDGSSGNAGNVSGLGNGSAQNYPVYGRILPQNAPNADRYSAVVTASLTF